MKKYLDKYEVADYLDLTKDELRQLRQSPAFPKPEYDGEQYLWRGEDIKAFGDKMNEYERLGWKMPIAFYPWPSFAEEQKGFVLKRPLTKGWRERYRQRV